MTLSVQLADLRHNFGGVLSTDCMPLGIGFMKAVMDREIPAADVCSRLFAYPNDLLEAMDSSPPDVYFGSNYVWNEALNLAFARRAKRLNPRALTIVGGPNLPLEPERQVAYVEAHPEIDIYVLGEGDFLASELVRTYIDAGLSIPEMGARELPGCVYRRPDGSLVRTELVGRTRDLDEIPSPWLTGIMDQFFDRKLAPIIETNRGCPFRCTFCVQGTGYYTRVNYFGLERLREEIDYVGRIIQERSPQVGTLRIADPNYGMYERDVEISGYIGEAQGKYGWPMFIDATTGKNRADRIIESMEKVNGALVLYQAVQSLDDEVLRNIDRANIKLDSYEKMQVHVRGRGLRSTSDLILGLPGESLQTHLRGLYKLIDAGTHQAHCFQAMMLKGAELETVATRERFKFDTRFRVLPKNFGIYGGEKVFDIEEIIVTTDTLPFEDYVTCREHHLIFSVFWNDSWFSDVVDVAERSGIKRSEWLMNMLGDTGVVRELRDDFVAETVGELFETREACRDFYADDANFERLCRGEIGDNLMYKYRARASFFLWKEICEAGMRRTLMQLQERAPETRTEAYAALWKDFATYTEARHAHGIRVEQILAPVVVELAYDIPSWLGEGTPTDVGPYRFDSPRRFLFSLTEEGAREIEAALNVWTSQLAGLTKLVTRIRVASQVRECRPVLHEPSTLGTGVA